MSSSRGVPDVWDDDWVDKPSISYEQSRQSDQSKKLSKAEKRRQQLEYNKKLWEEAESPGLPYLVQRKNDVPLQSGYASNVKVLSRKPTVSAEADRASPSNSNSTRTQAANDDNNDDEGEKTKGRKVTAEERAENSRKELEERQRRYEEVRQKIFGEAASNNRSNVSSNVNERGPRFSNASMPARNDRSRPRGRVANAGRNLVTRQLFDPNASNASVFSGIGRESSTIDDQTQRAFAPSLSRRGGRSETTRGGQGSSS